MQASRRSWALLAGAALVLIAGAVVAVVARSRPPGGAPGAAYAGSPACEACHPAEFRAWRGSHHALAERAFDPALDAPAFDPARRIVHGTQASSVRMSGGTAELVAADAGGRERAFPIAGVIGVDPLRQFLVPIGSGRVQVTELAFDPRRRDWFDVFGPEDRRPGEWGHWTGRGMSWNSMCAACHNTGLSKGYRPDSDGYQTTRAERGIGCEACHGPSGPHAAWQGRRGAGRDPTLLRPSSEAILATCGSCHARRAELTGRFAPGGAFLDHYWPAIPDETETYYADGQVREEDYEYVSFLGSRMHGKGVTCLDCHDPHSGRTRAEGDALCLRCHDGGPGGGPRIDPEAHAHHRPAHPGGRCVDCHMPVTVYMQRHPRRDHGFTTPDPLLTREHGIPNACGRCHADRGVDWAVQAVVRWYGPRLDRPTRERARTLARARTGDAAVVDALVRLSRDEPLPLWRAAATRLLARWSSRPEVAAALEARTRDRDALVRANAASALETAPESLRPEVGRNLRPLLDDPVRAVRVQAAWALRSDLDLRGPAGSDLLRFLEQGADQPAGQFQLGVLHQDRGEGAAALRCFERAAAWDPGSPVLRRSLAVALSAAGRRTEAVREMQAACRLAPEDASLRMELGIALSDAGDLAGATEALEQAVRLDPGLAEARRLLAELRDRGPAGR